MSETMKSAVEAIERLYKKHSAGGPAHIVFDDGNLEDEHIEFCIRYCFEETEDTESAILAVRALVIFSLLSSGERDFVYGEKEWRDE